MKALLLAAGKGSRLGGASGGVPKPLVELGGDTPLQHVLRRVAALPVEHIWINVHTAADLVRARIGESVAGVPVSYSYEPELLGTAGAWKALEAEWQHTSLVVYGDNFMGFDLGAMVARHERVGAAATVALYDPARHRNTGTGGGRARLESDRITRFEEGGREGLINAGVYVVEPSVSAFVPRGFSDFGHDILPRLAEAGLLAGHVLEDGAYCLGVDTPERLRVARQLLAPAEVA